MGWTMARSRGAWVEVVRVVAFSVVSSGPAILGRAGEAIGAWDAFIETLPREVVRGMGRVWVRRARDR